MRLFPNRMRPVNHREPESAVKTIADYIRYITERGEYFATNVIRRFEEVQRVTDEIGNNLTRIEAEDFARAGELRQMIEALEERVRALEPQPEPEPEEEGNENGTA